MRNSQVEKKSIISSAAVSIDIPIANNTLLNKAASQSTSLYQQCSSLRTTLLRIYGFSDFFALSAPPDSLRQSTDPVTQLWDCFALGTPLCYLYNLLPPPATPIAVNTDPATVDIHNERTKKRAIALFAMQIKQLSQAEQFTVTDLWDRNSTDGLVKVITTVTHLVDRLPPDVFLEEESQSSPSIGPGHDSTDSLTPASAVPVVAANAKEAARNNIIRELVETERKYVQDLEVMQKYSNSLSQSNTIDQDTIHLLFPNLNKLLNFQRKFLIRLEGTAEMPWIDQRWGILFTDNFNAQSGLSVIPCAHCSHACWFHTRLAHRDYLIWKQKEEEFAVYEPYCANYTNASDLMLMEEQNLMKFSHVINAKSELPAFLIKPVQRICKYPLLLDSLLKASSLAEYPHYEELKSGSAAAKRITDKINEAQRRAENVQTVQNLATRVDDWKGHHVSQFGELLLDDIFTVTKSEVDLSPSIGVYSLNVWWKGDDDLEFFTLRCRNEEQVKQWETSIKRLIEKVAARRASDRSTSRLAQHMNSTSPALPNRVPPSAYQHERNYSASQSNGIPAMPTHPYSTGGRSYRQASPYGSDEHVPTNGTGSFSNGPHGYPPHDGFDEADDDFEDYPPSAMQTSGRGTPADLRRGTMTPSLEREFTPAYERAHRAQTEDVNGAIMSSWRNNNQAMMPPPLPVSEHDEPRFRLELRLTPAAAVDATGPAETGQFVKAAVHVRELGATERRVVPSDSQHSAAAAVAVAERQPAEHVYPKVGCAAAARRAVGPFEVIDRDEAVQRIEPLN
ncbi:hypothetical protein EWM64_g8002 [Hericium alpestre]|uniref:DH domain-containing protein n=1 Tax=Hericium alpestre TaxID=135208 RepID=A0A4Y9ZR78_9AGAM|nr:hypothetical protein EWM64_g8002 [Hericium alpestre]